MTFQNIGAQNAVNHSVIKEIKTAKPADVFNPVEQDSSALNTSDKNNVSVLPQGSVPPTLSLEFDPVFPLSGKQADDFAQKFGFETTQAFQKITGDKPTGIITSESLKNIKAYFEEDIAILGKGVRAEANNFLTPEQQEQVGLNTDSEITQGTVINLDNLIQDNLKNMLDTKQFEALIKVMLIEMKNLDMVLSLIK